MSERVCRRGGRSCGKDSRVIIARMKATSPIASTMGNTPTSIGRTSRIHETFSVGRHSIVPCALRGTRDRSGLLLPGYGMSPRIVHQHAPPTPALPDQCLPASRCYNARDYPLYRRKGGQRCGGPVKSSLGTRACRCVDRRECVFRRGRVCAGAGAPDPDGSLGGAGQWRGHGGAAWLEPSQPVHRGRASGHHPRRTGLGALWRTRPSRPH